MRRMRQIFAALLASVLATGVSFAAEPYPSKPITLVIPYASGGPMDTFARLAADILTERLGQRVIVENRGGAGGVIGTKSAMKAPPDGYTLIFGTSGTLDIAPLLYKNVEFDPKPLVPVGLIAKLPHVMTVHPSLPIKTVREFIDYAKAHPGELTYGATVSTPPHLLGLLLKQQANIDIVYVPNKGAASAILDLISGRTQFGFDSVTVNYPLVQDGKLRPLAVGDEERSPLLPDVPTMAESGFPNFHISAYCGLLAPEGTPRDIVEKINNALNDGLSSDRGKEVIKQFNASAKPGTPQEFAAYMRRMNTEWTNVVTMAGVKSHD